MARKAVTFSQEACNYFILVLRYEKVFSEVEDDQRRIPGIEALMIVVTILRILTN